MFRQLNKWMNEAITLRPLTQPFILIDKRTLLIRELWGDSSLDFDCVMAQNFSKSLQCLWLHLKASSLLCSLTAFHGLYAQSHECYINVKESLNIESHIKIGFSKPNTVLQTKHGSPADSKSLVSQSSCLRYSKPHMLL